jgi:hypothetical protein
MGHLSKACNLTVTGWGAGNAGKVITEIEYKPSSGIMFKAKPDKTTTILGGNKLCLFQKGKCVNYTLALL